MGDVSKIAAVRVDGGPECAVTISSDALGSQVTLCGELDLASAPDLHQVLDRLCRDGFPEIGIDLSGLEFLTAAGLAVFHRADEHLRAAGGRLILHRPGRLARRVLAITELDTVLTIRPATPGSLNQASSSAATPPPNATCSTDSSAASTTACQPDSTTTNTSHSPPPTPTQPGRQLDKLGAWDVSSAG
jgi:anti-anti-sigma factor